MRKIIEVHGEIITYVNRGKLAFPTWDTNKWLSANRDVFSREVLRKVPCDWRGEGSD